MKHDKSLLTLCLILVEKQAGLGESQYWTNAEFEMLGEKILSQTNVSLSASTLKRLWGRVKYTSVPQKATLNALAQFIGYPSYWDFTVVHENESKQMPVSSRQVSEKRSSRKRILSHSGIWSIGLVMGLFLSLLLAFSLSRQRKEAELFAPSQYSFSSRPVTQGIPNSVVFTFDVSQAETDCLQIQQSWDEKLRFTIQKDQHVATSIYYYPGFFNAKLLVDDQVAKEHPLYIKTKGWLPLVEQNPVPVYFTEEESRQEGTFGLTVDQLKDKNISLQPEVPWVSYYYVQEMDGLSSSDFTLETSIRNTYAVGSGACQNSYLGILCENSAIAIPLSVPGCTSAVSAFIAGESLEGSKADLSGFGVDFHQWVKLKLIVDNKTAQILVNGEPVLEQAFSMDAGKIIGIVYRFQGTGSVDYLHLYDRSGTMVFQEEF